MLPSYTLLSNARLRFLIYSLLWLLLLLPFQGFAQKKHLNFKHISSEEGLSHSTVTCAFQDSKGLMWFGTKEGLNKYDGYKFTVFKHDPKNPCSISNNLIKKIREDAKGNLWIATSGGGLNKWERSSEKFHHFGHDKNNSASISSDYINDIVVDYEGKVWAAADNGGINRLNAKNNTFDHYLKELSHSSVQVLLEDSQQNIWIGTAGGGLDMYNPKNNQFTHFSHQPTDKGSLSHNIVWTIFEDSRKNIWVGTYGGGLNLLDKKTGKFKHYQKDIHSDNSLIHDFVISIAEDVEGNLWIGAENSGISVFDPLTEKFTNYAYDETDYTSLSSPSIDCVYKDSRGNMWIGTFSGGINFVNRDASQFNHQKHIPSNPNSLSNNKVTSICEDSDDNIWLGTDGGGMDRFDRKTGQFTHYRHDPTNANSLCGDYVLKIVEDFEHNLWIGTWGDGLSFYNRKQNTFTNYKKKAGDINSLGSDNVWSILEDHKHQIWIGTFGGGLNLFDRASGTFTQIAGANYNINSLFEDSQNTLWVGGNAAGLNQYDKEKNRIVEFVHDKNNKTLSNNNVSVIEEDKQGNLWIGTRNGLNCLDIRNNLLTDYYVKDGLPNDAIAGIMEDKNGNLWLSTSKGVSKFNPATKKFKNFSISDGLQANEFKEGSYCKTRNETMYFGGINGFNEFFPDGMQEKPYDPPFLFTDFQIFNKPVALSDSLHEKSVLSKPIAETSHLTLAYNQSVITFEFASLNFTSAEKKQYSYQLEGFDQGWNTIGEKHSITFTNLDPGEYRLKVRGLTNAGEWSSKSKDILITITPPFWKTWWFRILAILIVIASSITYYKSKINAIKAQKEKLESQVLERTAEVLTQKEELEVQAENMQMINKQLIGQKEELEEKQEAILQQQEEILQQRDNLEEINQQVMSSINYARSIQQAMLPSQKKMDARFKDHFVLYRPKDVVSGDFYWFSHLTTDERDGEQNSHFTFLAAIDCTGHGVPGAFMSIVANTLLNEIINLKRIFDPAQILNTLDLGVSQTVNKIEGVNTAGMDICLVRLQEGEGGQVKVGFSGAKRPLLFLRKESSQLAILDSDRKSIGSNSSQGKSFTNQELVLQEGDSIYLYTDGFTDQNNANRERFGTKKLIALINQSHTLPMSDQKTVFANELDKHQAHTDQRDDITFLGVRL
jgi:ligand-binding sensor domain-containing protein/serine phosphatase RsbU (regulator of sigma subunit)